MHLMYLDDSGSARNKSEEFFVLAGVSVFERQGYWLSKAVNDLLKAIFPVDWASVELHASPILSGNKRWRAVPKAERLAFLADALTLLVQSPRRSVRLFGAAISKTKSGEFDPVLLAYEQTVSRFDQFLGRLYKAGETQRGIVIFDKSSSEADLQRVSATYADAGHKWGVLHNIVEVPLFLDSRASRLVQLADLVAFAIYRNFEKGDNRLFDIIEPAFDRDGGVRHGLYFNGPPRTQNLRTE
jgi:Protein of unknown function (DUF3800)